MGGCASTWNKIELAGAVIGAGVAEAATGGVAAAGAVAAAGSAGAYFATKKGCDKSPEALIQVTREITATAIVLSVNQCQEVASISQDIVITCLPDLPENEVYENNSACGACFRAVFNGMLAGHAQERQVWQRGGEVKVRLPINQEYALLLGRLGTCGINTCKACSLANVTQSNVLNESSTCYDSIKSEANFKNNLTSIVQQQLLNNQDVLSGVAQALGAQGVNKITEKIVSRISSRVTSTFLNNLGNVMQSAQVITIDASGSTTSQNISQYSAFNLALQAVTEQNIIEDTIDTAVFNTISQVANDQNTLNDIGEVVFESTVDFTKAINNSVGQVMIATLVALGVVVLVVIGYALYRFFKKTFVTTKNLEKKIEQRREKAPVLEQF